MHVSKVRGEASLEADVYFTAPQGSSRDRDCGNGRRGEGGLRVIEKDATERGMRVFHMARSDTDRFSNVDLSFLSVIGGHFLGVTCPRYLLSGKL
uniref:Uncharacterized protein n=1 Tax=Candidatus Kentrum sp. FW TaxID=2126338 RepID=A0A450TZZ9_9GAMM|nr:MAG: hypothetical protein BECKFW1821C_GA0114237_108010 [Candidatus Kentron sp. FW]